MTVSVSYLSKNCTTCLFISKSFKELFFMAFFSKADAKVRLIFELPKLFEVFFSKKSFFWKWQVQDPIPFQHFNCTAFLSRKRVQKYCFTAYPPNLHNTFFALFCILPPKSLILKRCRRAYFEHLWSRKRTTREHYI